MKKILSGILALTILFGSFMVSASAEETPNVLNVSGSYTVVSVADEAYVSIGVKTNNIDYKKCQDDNKNKMNDVTNAIKSLGIEEKYIKTTNYDSVPIYDYVPTNEYTGVYYNGTYYNKRVLKEYQLTHMIRVNITDVSLVGKLIDITVQNGVNELNNVQFALSNPRQHELYLQALEGASQRAKDKADTLAKAFGIKELKIKSINAENMYYSSSYSYNAVGGSGGGMPMVAKDDSSTAITSGELQVTATVNIVYTY